MDEKTDSQVIVDLPTRRVWRGEQELALSGLEYGVFEYLAERAGTVVSYEELWRQVWGGVGSFNRHEYNMVRECLKRLRRKLGDDAEQPNYLVVVYGRGVYLNHSSVGIREG